MLLRETQTLAVVAATAAFKELLREHKIFIGDRGSYERWNEKTAVSFHKDTAIEPYVGFFRGETLCTMGAFSYSHSALPIGMLIGRYCSIASGLKPIGSDHPTEAVSTSPAFYDRQVAFSAAAASDLGHTFPWSRMPFSDQDPPEIGNDVWITSDVTLNRRTKVGDGAVVLRGSVVTKDLPGFSLSGGIPAIFKRPRFAGDIGQRMAATEWWKFSPKDLSEFPMHDPAQFLERWAAEGSDLTPWKPPALKLWDAVKSLI